MFIARIKNKEATKAADVSKGVTIVHSKNKEATKAADVAKGVTIVHSKNKEATKAADVAKGVTIVHSKNKEATKAADVAKGETIVHSKQVPQIMDEVEKLLLTLIYIKELYGDSISEDIICDKVLYIYADLLKETPNMRVEGESWFTFKASRGWFNKFQHQS